jgi:DNA-binding GntR family transcriptional regulator
MSTEAIPFESPKGRRPAQPDLVALTYDRLRALIVSGRLSPGSRIIESDLADRLGVSRTPVRSALQRLQQEGFVQGLDGGRNARLIVSPLTREDCRELLSLMGALEGLAARAAATLPERERKALAADQRALNDQFTEALRRAEIDPDEVFRVHTAFHATHLDAAATPRLRHLYAAIQPQAERYRRVYITSSPQGLFGEVTEHVPIIEAIERGDGPAAQAAVQENWLAAADRMGKIVDRLGDRGAW